MKNDNHWPFVWWLTRQLICSAVIILLAIGINAVGYHLISYMVLALGLGALLYTCWHHVRWQLQMTRKLLAKQW
ncbi:MAG TPA: hypothetical protein VKP88_03860 [Candidatus Paceibacterota bacterium]|nr:hypothetical protein [Candidatus Paceibacterota bacterium]